MAETPAYRLLHTMVRVRDLDKSLDFYTRLLGMTLLRKTDYPSGRFTLAFVGYGDEQETAVIELTHRLSAPNRTGINSSGPAAGLKIIAGRKLIDGDKLRV